MSALIITGARGYIGTALTKRLASEGHALRLVSRSRAIPAADLVFNGNVDYREADLRDPQAWSNLLRNADNIVHLAWRTDLRAADAFPTEDEDINVRPVRALVEAAHRAAKPPIIVFASAVTIAGPNPPLPVDETTADRPCSVYDRHKLVAETILREATARGIVRACSLRLSNVYGHGSAPINSNRGVLNTMLKRAIAGESVTLYREAAYIRDFIHIDDVVKAFRCALTPQVCDGRHYIIASGRGHTLVEAYGLIAEIARTKTRRRIDILRVDEPPDLHPIEKRNFVGNSRVFQDLTGWQSHFDLRAGIIDYFERADQPAMAH